MSFCQRVVTAAVQQEGGTAQYCAAASCRRCRAELRWRLGCSSLLLQVNSAVERMHADGNSLTNSLTSVDDVPIHHMHASKLATCCIQLSAPSFLVNTICSIERPAMHGQSYMDGWTDGSMLFNCSPVSIRWATHVDV